MVAMRVCPFCGQPPGSGVFCEACGRNLAEVEQLPTREEWEASGGAAATPAPAAAPAGLSAPDFVAAMRELGNPGAIRVPSGPARAFRKTPTLEGWIIVAVDRDEDDLAGGRYASGLFLTVDGTWHRLDNDVRGWGQRDFPQFEHRVEPEPLPAPGDAQVGARLAEVLAARQERERARRR
jgi:hypothetical protein